MGDRIKSYNGVWVVKQTHSPVLPGESSTYQHSFDSQTLTHKALWQALDGLSTRRYSPDMKSRLCRDPEARQGLHQRLSAFLAHIGLLQPII